MRALPRVVPLLAVLLLAGCGVAPSVRYGVAFRDDQRPDVTVTVEIQGARRDSLVLEGLTPAALMPISRVEALGPNGLLRSSLSVRPVGVGAARRDYDFVRVEGPLPSHVSVRYRVRLGAREGDAHTGFTGRRAGDFQPGYAFAGGRSLFLVPRGARSGRPIDVRFELPSGWAAVTPWRREGEVWRAGASGEAPVADLLRAPLAFGRFIERSMTLHGTRFRFMIEAGISDSLREPTLARLEAETREVVDAIGRGLGPEFLAVVVPEHPAGDELMLEGGGFGIGGTLAPLTTNRARGFALGLLDGYFAGGPHQLRPHAASERWIVDGLEAWLPWQAVERAGLAGREDFERQLGVELARALEARDSSSVEWNLERLPASENDTQLGRETLAPVALMRLDAGVRVETGGWETLETVLHRMFDRPDARSLWASLPHARAPRWASLRERWVRGVGTRVDSSLFTLAPASDAPDPPRGPIVSRLIVACTANTYGYLENCGCKVNQAGGVARRATILDGLRRDGPVLVVDAGNALQRPDPFEPPDYLAIQEEKLYLRTLGLMGYALGAAGTAELAYGLDRFREAATETKFPFVLANVRDSAGLIAPAWRVVRAGPVRVGLVGLMEPGRGPWANDVMERRLDGQVRFDDPVATLQQLLPEVRRGSDLVGAIGRLSPATVRRLARECPDLDLIVSSDDEAPSVGDEDGERVVASSDGTGFHGRTLVLYGSGAAALGGAVLGLDAQHRIASADPFAHWLGDSVADAPRIREALTKFYQDIGRSDAAQASVHPLFPDDPARMTGNYAGVDRCASCHAAETAQWRETAHAHAWKTLLDVHRHFQPRCVVCHVVGLGTAHGYRLGGDQRLVNVQCEVCHGPGADHAAAPHARNIRRQVPEPICLQCHDSDHSDHFVYADKRPRIVHR